MATLPHNPRVGTRKLRKGGRVLRSPFHERAVAVRPSWDGVAGVPLASLHGFSGGVSSLRSWRDLPSPYPSHLRREGKP